MIGSGLNFFANTLGISNNLMVYYGFTGISGIKETNNSFIYPQYSGSISDTVSFYLKSGSWRSMVIHILQFKMQAVYTAITSQ